MPVKRKNGKYVECDWCGEFPRDTHRHTYTHTNIFNDPPVKYFCTKKCLERWVFQTIPEIITSFSNLNESLFIYTKFDYKNVRYK